MTGGAGYIGSHLVRKLLQRGHHVRVLDAPLYGDQGLVPFRNNPKFELVQADVRDPDGVARAVKGARGVVALASLVGDPACEIDPAATWATNVEATAELLARCREGGRTSRVRVLLQRLGCQWRRTAHRKLASQPGIALRA